MVHGLSIKMSESLEMFSNDDQFIENLLKESVGGGSKQVDNSEGETTAADSKSVPHKKLTEFPITRIRTIMKMDPDVHIASQEAVYLIAKATELFLDSLAKETYRHTMKAKRKTVQRRDLDAAIETMDSLCFLEGALD